jgi:hypothetical protein
MALLLKQKQVYRIIQEYDGKPEKLVANTTAIEKAAFKEWLNHHGVARSTILLGMEPRIHGEFIVIEDTKTL